MQTDISTERHYNTWGVMGRHQRISDYREITYDDHSAGAPWLRCLTRA